MYNIYLNLVLISSHFCLSSLGFHCTPIFPSPHSYLIWFLSNYFWNELVFWIVHLDFLSNSPSLSSNQFSLIVISHRGTEKKWAKYLNNLKRIKKGISALKIYCISFHIIHLHSKMALPAPSVVWQHYFICVILPWHPL